MRLSVIVALFALLIGSADAQVYNPGGVSPNAQIVTPTLSSPTITGAPTLSASGLTLQNLTQGGNAIIGGAPGGLTNEYAGASITSGTEISAFGDLACGNVTTGSFIVFL